MKDRLARDIARWGRCISKVAAGRGGPDAVHQLRVLTRKCREGFRLLGYKNEALSRLSHSLGPARDVEMLWQRLASARHSSTEGRRLLKLIDQQHHAARRNLTTQLRSKRAKQLGDSLEKQIRQIALTDAEEEALARAGLRKAYKHLRRLWINRPKLPANGYFHPLRRAIRRLRYAGECAASTDGKALEHLANSAAHWQGFLGEYQDAIIAQRLLKTVPGSGARLARNNFQAMQKKTAKRFWKKWRRRGWKKINRRAKKAIKSL